MRESLIQSAILEYLAARRILAFRMQVGMANMGGRHVRFGVQGMADILACPERLDEDGDRPELEESVRCHVRVLR